MKKFEIMDACKSSAKDFCETLLFCLEDDGIFTIRSSPFWSLY